MIIDTHTHFYDPSRPQGVPWPPPENQLLYRTVLPADFVAVAAPHGVTKTVVVEASPWPADNDWVLALAAQNDVILALVGNVEPNRPEFAAQLHQWAHNPLFRGIRCGGRHLEALDAGSMLADMATLASADLSLDLLIRHEHVANLLRLAKQIPTLRIIINHIGHMPIDGAAIDGAWVEWYQALAAQPNIWLKVSALLEQSTSQPAPTTLDFYRPTLDVLWNSFGSERLIYGSNWPVLARAGSYATAINLLKEYFTEKGESAYQRYFWENAQYVYQC